MGILGFVGFLIIQSQKFYFFTSESVNLFECIGVVLLSNVQDSSVWDNLRALLGRIFESSVPRSLKT